MAHYQGCGHQGRVSGEISALIGRHTDEVVSYIVARLIAQQLSTMLGEQVIVENRVGAAATSPANCSRTQHLTATRRCYRLRSTLGTPPCTITSIEGASKLGNAAFESAYLVARARRLMTNGQFTQGYKLIKDFPENDFIAALQLLAEEETTFLKVFQIRERYSTKETEPIARVLARAAKAGDVDAISLLGTGILVIPLSNS